MDTNKSLKVGPARLSKGPRLSSCADKFDIFVLPVETFPVGLYIYTVHGAKGTVHGHTQHPTAFSVVSVSH